MVKTVVLPYYYSPRVTLADKGGGEELETFTRPCSFTMGSAKGRS